MVQLLTFFLVEEEESDLSAAILRAMVNMYKGGRPQSVRSPGSSVSSHASSISRTSTFKRKKNQEGDRLAAAMLLAINWDRSPL